MRYLPVDLRANVLGCCNNDVSTTGTNVSGGYLPDEHAAEPDSQ